MIYRISKNFIRWTVHLCCIRTWFEKRRARMLNKEIESTSLSNNHLNDVHTTMTISHILQIHLVLWRAYCTDEKFFKGDVILLIWLSCYKYLYCMHYVIKVQIIVIITAAINHYDVKWNTNIHWKLYFINSNKRICEKWQKLFLSITFTKFITTNIIIYHAFLEQVLLEKTRYIINNLNYFTL